MSLVVSIPSVNLTGENELEVLVAVSVEGETTPISYTGGVTTASVPEPDDASIEGEVGMGEGEEHLVTLTTGYSEDDFPAEVLVTAALDDGTQEQVWVEIDQEGEVPTDPGNGDGLSAGDIAIATVGVAGLAFGVSRLNRFRQGFN